MMIFLTATEEKRPVKSADELDAYISRIASDNDNKEAFTALYAQTSTSIYAFALSILKNTHDAEDVLHDCFVNIHAAAADYKSIGKPMAWIMTITRNLCMLKLRERKKVADLEPEMWEPFLEFREEVTAEDRLMIDECLNRLTDEERQIVVLHLVSGFKHREIAQFLKLPLATVLSKYHRAIKKLKRIFEKGEKQDER